MTLDAWADSATTATWFGSWGQAVGAVAGVLGLSLSALAYFGGKNRDQAQDEQRADLVTAVEDQAKAAKDGLAAEAAERVRQFDEMTAEAARRDKEIALLITEDKRREDELQLLREQVAAVRRAEEREAKRNAAMISVSLVPSPAQLRGVQVYEGDHLWAVLVQNNSGLTVRNLRAGIRRGTTDGTYEDARGFSPPFPIGRTGVVSVTEGNRVPTLNAGQQCYLIFAVSKMAQPKPEFAIRFVDDDAFEWQRSDSYPTSPATKEDWR